MIPRFWDCAPFYLFGVCSHQDGMPTLPPTALQIPHLISEALCLLSQKPLSNSEAFWYVLRCSPNSVVSVVADTTPQSLQVSGLGSTHSLQDHSYNSHLCPHPLALPLPDYSPWPPLKWIVFNTGWNISHPSFYLILRKGADGERQTWGEHQY